ncbi:hypothetical protein Peur_008711 [Populus x canadensis]
MHRSLYPFFCLCPLQKEPHRYRIHGLECLREVESLQQTAVSSRALLYSTLEERDRRQGASAIKAKYHVPPSS